ncbi:MAG: HAD-IA family hydrolase [Fibrella sp.]|nr:HAD-IA family hydrolase [Armatimonadota bacterium]
MTKKLHAVLFDLDGTLVRTFIDFPAMRHEVQERVRELYHGDDTILQNSDSLDVIAETVARLPPDQREEARNDLYSLLEKHEEVGCKNPEAIPGATTLLHTLHSQGVGLAVVTRNARRIATALCHRMRLPVNVIIAREDTATYKPHPEPIHRACDRLRTAPEYAAMVGDLWADVAAGVAAGCATTIGIQWAHDPPDRFAKAKPSYIVTTLEEAGKILLPAVR